MAITVQQIQGAQQTAQQLMTEIQQMMGFLAQLLALANSGWQITQTVGGIQVVVVIDAPTQANLLAAYNTLKGSLVATFGQLP